LLKRRSHLTPEEFETRWLKEHVAISSKLPGLLGYRINIATPRQPVSVGGEPIYDGTAEMWWETADAMETAFASEAGVAAGIDADQFADVRIHVYTEEHIVIPGPSHDA
jgi:uncharacterized protein (TIGR02118 family)